MLYQSNMEVDGLPCKEAQTIEHKGTASKEYPVRRYKSRVRFNSPK